MVVQRKISLRVYALAGVLTLLIFLLGLTLGFILENERLEWGKDQSVQQELDYKSLQFQYMLLTDVQNSNQSCNILQTALQKQISELGETLDQLLEYKQDTTLKKEDFESIQRRYIIDNMKYWLLVRKTKKMCGADVVSILYFYSGKNCDVCPDQGVILTYFKKKLDEKLLVFPIDIDLKEVEPAIEILVGAYGIETYPTLVVEEKSYPGIMSKSNLSMLLCSEFDSELSWC